MTTIKAPEPNGRLRQHDTVEILLAAALERARYSRDTQFVYYYERLLMESATIPLWPPEENGRVVKAAPLR